MKQANEIIKHLFCASSNKLSKSRFFLRAVELMPENISRELLFCYMNDKTLYFVTKNRSMLFELNYKLKSLKEALLYLAKHGDYEEFMDFKEVKVFVTKYENTPMQKAVPTITYTENERSCGNFINLSKNSKFYPIFEEIRELIKS